MPVTVSSISLPGLLIGFLAFLQPLVLGKRDGTALERVCVVLLSCLFAEVFLTAGTVKQCGRRPLELESHCTDEIGFEVNGWVFGLVVTVGDPGAISALLNRAPTAC